MMNPYNPIIDKEIQDLFKEETQRTGDRSGLHFLYMEYQYSGQEED